MTSADRPIEPALEAALQRLADGRPLEQEIVAEAFAVVMTGNASQASLAALLLGIRARGETAQVIVGVALAMRQVMIRVTPRSRDHLIDTCGTGGGGLGTLNISTAAAFVAAAAGVPVAKHGNRSYTSRSGSADVLEALGVSTELNAAQAERVLEQAGIAFLFAPTYHPAMRHLAAVRRELGVATVMNLVGPLANPAMPERQVVGVADPATGPLIAAALLELGATRAVVVHGEIGVDELSPVGTSRIWQVGGGAILEQRFDPEEWGMATPDMSGTEGGTPVENAAAISDLFRQPRRVKPALRAAVLLNAAAAIEVSGVVPDFAAAISLATLALDHGAAFERLELLRRLAPLRTSG